MDNFRESHHSELICRSPRLAAGRNHLWTGHAEAPHVGNSSAQCVNERSTQSVARGLPGDEANGERGSGGDPLESRRRNGRRLRRFAHRTMLRVELATKSTKALTSGCVSPSTRNFSVASASLRSERYRMRYA